MKYYSVLHIMKVKKEKKEIKKPKKVIVSVTIDPDIKKIGEDQASFEGRSFSNYIERLIAIK